MDTLKTAVVVVLLLAVLYGVYVTLNQPEQEVSKEIAWAQQEASAPLQVDFDTVPGSGSEGATATLAAAAPWNTEPAADMSEQAGGMHEHHNPIAASESAEPPPAQIGYGSLPATATADRAVAAPDLITSPGSTEPLGPWDGTAGSATAPTAPTVEQPSGYDSRSEFASNPTAEATSQPPTPAATTSVYGPPTSNVGAPAGNYGDPAGLAGNPQSIAAMEPPVADSYDQSATAPGAGSPEIPSSRIDGDVAAARENINLGQHYEALFSLSLAYAAPGRSAEERTQLQAWLDPLAGKVIYSKEHLKDNPYLVQAGDTLQSVAEKYKVPWQLLANINGLRDPAAVQPGMSIKVLPGPFHAEVDLTDSSLTLYLGRLYAGRFAITVNGNNVPVAGEYQVNDKQPGHSFYAGDAQTLAPQDPQNPFGGIWIDLGGNVAIHSTSNSPGQSERLGCISLAAKDANDLYGILSLGSNVVIRR